MALGKYRRKLLTIQDTYQARLDQLVEKKAALGYSVDPAVTLEIEDIEREMSENSAVLHAINIVTELSKENKRLSDPTQPQPALEDRRNHEENYKAMIATVQATVAEFSNVKKQMSDGFESIKEDINDVRKYVKDELLQVYIIMAVAFGALLLVVLFK